jgi:hypothetical protein
MLFGMYNIILVSYTNLKQEEIKLLPAAAILASLILFLYLGAIPQALAGLDAIQPIPSKTIDRGTTSVAFPIRVSSSFVDPSDTSDTVRLEIRSNDPLIQWVLGFVPRNLSPFSPNPLQIERSNPKGDATLEIPTQPLIPRAYGFRIIAVDENGKTVSVPGCLIVRPTQQLSCPPPPQQQPPPTTPPIATLPSLALTGVWQANDGGTYYLRQIGDVLWWNGMSGGNDGRTFDNVFRGTITSTTNTIAGEWADVPRGTIMGSGTLGLKIINPTTLQKVSQTGGFGATTWQKVR